MSNFFFPKHDYCGIFKITSSIKIRQGLRSGLEKAEKSPLGTFSLPMASATCNLQPAYGWPEDQCRGTTSQNRWAQSTPAERTNRLSSPASGKRLQKKCRKTDVKGVGKKRDIRTECGSHVHIVCNIWLNSRNLTDAFRGRVGCS